MDKDNLMTAAEVAKIVGVSRQAIYKRMDTDLSTYVVKVDNKKWLKSKVLEHFSVNLSTSKVDKLTEVDTLKKMVEMLERENELKQQTIEQLRKEKEEEHQQLMQLTSQVGTTLQALTQGQLADKLIQGKQLNDDLAAVDVPKKKHWWQK